MANSATAQYVEPSSGKLTDC